MKRILVVLATAAAVATVGSVGVDLADPQKADAARLRNFTKTDIAQQSGDAKQAENNPNINALDDPFTYSRVGKIRRITQITITATLDDADTDPGNFDENNLTLALDGIDTGIKLNGYPDAEAPTLTNSGVPINADQILAALKADGKLQASIIDATFDGNILTVPSESETTLTIKGKRRR